jgi:hypothetical protein
MSLILKLEIFISSSESGHRLYRHTALQSALIKAAVFQSNGTLSHLAMM